MLVVAITYARHDATTAARPAHVLRCDCSPILIVDMGLDLLMLPLPREVKISRLKSANDLQTMLSQA